GAAPPPGRRDVALRPRPPRRHRRPRPAPGRREDVRADVEGLGEPGRVSARSAKTPGADATRLAPIDPPPSGDGMTPRKTKTSSLADRLMERLKLRTATVSVVGLGYVGLPLAETFAAGGFTVIGFDIDDEKIAKLKAGESYIKHISSQRIGDLRDN